MSTLQVDGKRFFKLAVNILVIALAVKSVPAFEGKSDTVRQAFSHREQLLLEINSLLPRDGELGKDLILLEQRNKKPDSYKGFSDAFEVSLDWIKKNPRKKVLTISLVGLTDSPKKESIINNEDFLPVAVLIIFRKDN